jgi:hypothetical protein
MKQPTSFVFVNGLYAPQLSVIRSASLCVVSLEDASRGEFRELVLAQLGQSSRIINDGLNALNTAFAAIGVLFR